MGQQEFLRELQGSMTQTEFANHLGISQPMLSMVLAGQRPGGKSLIRGLLRAYPNRRDEIIALFFLASEDCKSNVSIAESVE